MNELALADDAWTDRFNYLKWHLGNEVGRRWWEHSKRNFPEDFVATVDRILSADEYRDNRELLDALRSGKVSETLT